MKIIFQIVLITLFVSLNCKSYLDITRICIIISIKFNIIIL